MSRVKHLFAVALAALMLCLLMPITAFAEEASDGKMIVYAKLPSDWSDPHLWAWADDGTNAFDAWPGGEWKQTATTTVGITAGFLKPQTTLSSMRTKQQFRLVTISWKAKMLGSR